MASPQRGNESPPDLGDFLAIQSQQKANLFAAEYAVEFFDL